MMDTCHYTPVQTHRLYTPRVTAKVDHGLWVITTCPYRFFSCNKRTTLVGTLTMGWLGLCGRGDHVGNLCTFLSLSL